MPCRSVFQIHRWRYVSVRRSAQGRDLSVADRVRRVLATATAIIALVGALSGCADPHPDEPPGYLVALINATAPDNDVSSTQFCTGVLITETEVLTAAHCLRDRESLSIDAIVGAKNLCNTGPIQGERVGVQSMNLSDSVDAAVLTLSRAVDRAPAATDRPEAETGSVAVAWGWGKDSMGGVAPCDAEPKELVIVLPSACLGAPGAGPGTLCGIPAGDANTCEGDSGGPLVGRDGSIKAITTSGLGCGQDDAGVYLSVDVALAALR
jgi:secreted trypsin-like serine protease